MTLTVNGLLQDYLPDSTAVVAQRAQDDFAHIAPQVARATVAQGLSEALRSEQTPPFSQLVSQLFAHANPEERASIINQLVQSLPPELWRSLAGGLLGSLFQANGGHATVTPEEAAVISAEQVQEIAAGAERQNANAVDNMGKFFAQYSDLVKRLDSTAVAFALGKIAQAETTSNITTSAN